MIARIPKSRIGINFAIMLFLTAGLNGCLGSSDGVDVNEERVPIVLALDSNLESASGIFDDPLLSTFESSPRLSVGTYPVDSEAAKIEALRFGHIDVALVDGATAWMGWKEYGLKCWPQRSISRAELITMPTRGSDRQIQSQLLILTEIKTQILSSYSRGGSPASQDGQIQSGHCCRWVSCLA